MAVENKNNIIAEKENDNFEVKTDCFAYREGKPDEYACSALNDLYCRREKCGFYKPKKS